MNFSMLSFESMTRSSSSVPPTTLEENQTALKMSLTNKSRVGRTVEVEQTHANHSENTRFNTSMYAKSYFLKKSVPELAI